MAEDSTFSHFLKKAKWKKGVVKLCKPCWELRYCPYGPLVEEYPLKQIRDSQSCRIYGHDCPVYSLAEPFTETKELRTITRTIPQAAKIEAIKRDGSVCAKCRQNIHSDEIHYDHIIPWSKGGSSDASNIRILCEECNQKRSNRFEVENLVLNGRERIMPHTDFAFVRIFLDVVIFYHDFIREYKRQPTSLDFADEFHCGEPSEFEERIIESIAELGHFFKSSVPKEITRNQFEALKWRWGFKDGYLYSIKDIAEDFSEQVADLVILERYLLSIIGWFIEESRSNMRKWADY